MANLIITIIAIALVAVAALMGAYYGGTAFNQGQDRAKASTLINQAAQIEAAVIMYGVDNSGGSPANIAALVTDGYLSSTPGIGSDAWSTAGTTAVWAGTPTAEMCTVLEAVDGFADCSATPAANDIVFTF